MEAFGNANLVKQLHLDENGRDKLIKGIDKLATAVGSTLGASGRNVLIEDQFGNVQSTKDGVSVASYVTLSDPVENMGSTLLKQAAKKTAMVAGDGTTSATVLGAAIIDGYLNSKDKDTVSFREIKKGIEDCRDYVLEEIDKKSIAVDNKRLKEVSIISSNNDTELGSLIADAFEQAGEHGVVTVLDSPTNDTYIKSVSGTHLVEKCEQPHFYTDRTREIAELENPFILISADKINNLRDIQEVLGHAMKSNRSILIIAPLEQQPMSALAMNKLKGNIKVNVISPPSFGLRQKDLLDDVALLTGATVIDESLGDAIDRITSSVLGSAERAISDKDGTTLITNNDEEKVQERIDTLKKDLECEDHHVLKSHIERRLAILTGGVSQIYVGAETDVAKNEKKDRVDDATSAVKAAKKEGILPGGGAALHYFALNKGDSVGWNILSEALYAPFNKILDNAGLNPMDKKYNIKKWGLGVDVIDGEVKDMIKSGIIDPALVTKEVVRNAVSVALAVLSTDVVISNVREVS